MPDSWPGHVPAHDARGQPLPAAAQFRYLRRKALELLITAGIFVVLLAFIAATLLAIWLHVDALLQFGGFVGIISVATYITSAAALLWLLNIAHRQRRDVALARRAFDTASIGTHCSACDYELDPNLRRADDNCKVCPECGAAWRESGFSMPAWWTRQEGWCRDLRDILVPLHRDKTDAQVLEAARLSSPAAYRWMRNTATLLLSMIIFATLYVAGQNPSSSVATAIFAVVAAGIMFVSVLVLSHHRITLRRELSRSLANATCPHCDAALARDSLGHQHCPTCKCEW